MTTTTTREPRRGPRRFALLTAALLLPLLTVVGVGGASTGGPDDGGYTWIDSHEANGPTYNFQDISGTGLPTGPACDDCVAGPFPMSFPFTFYDAPYTNVYVSSNGFLLFEPGSNGCCSGEWMPDPAGPNNLVAGYWADLDPRTGGSITYQDLGTVFIVQWTDMRHYGSSSIEATFQIQLHADGRIQVHYAFAGPRSSATAGIESPGGATGLTYLAGFDSVGELAVEYRCDACSSVPVPPVGVSAYGKIWITDAGTGPVVTTNYDPAFWSCVQVINAATPTATCTPTAPPPQPNGYWVCSLMILRAQTTGLTGAVRGEVDCDTGAAPAPLTTGDVTGAAGSGYASGYLGPVAAIVCQAFGVNGAPVPVPPYNVECYEPGAPETDLGALGPARLVERVVG